MESVHASLGTDEKAAEETGRDSDDDDDERNHPNHRPDDTLSEQEDATMSDLDEIDDNDIQALAAAARRLKRARLREQH